MFRLVLTAVLAAFIATGAIAQSDYKIKAGDTLGVEVLEDNTLNRNLLVLPDGTISFPLVGTIKAAGLSVGQLKSSITQGLAPNFAATPSVFVSIKTISKAVATGGGTRKIEVFLMGEVNQPGSHSVTRGTTLLQFLAQTGGFTKFAAKKRLQLRRTSDSGGSNVYRINYKAIEEGRNIEAGMTVLRSGDVIIVPERRLFE